MDSRRSNQALTATLATALLLGCAAAAISPGAARAGEGIGQVTVAMAPHAAARAAPSPTKIYACTKLISLAQLRKVTGLSDATYVGGSSAGLPKGETYCQFLARKGATSISLTVWTGPSLATFDALWAAGAGAERVSGIGDAARVSVPNRSGGARVGGTGIGVALTATGTKGLAGVNVRSAITKILAVVAKRV